MEMFTLEKRQLPLILLFALSFTLIIISCNKEEECAKSTWYEDADGDGLGNLISSVEECAQPTGYVSNGNDGDDSSAAVADKTVTAQILSVNIGESYPISIFVPSAYHSNKNLPVVYLLDGLIVFMGKTFYQDLVSYVKSIELEAILVAVSDKTGADRERDYSPANCGAGDGTSFENFYKFLTEEVVSYIDDRYENDHDSRTLIGFSHAGKFANFALFKEKPENIIFNNFVSVDPSGCGTEITEQYVDNMAFSSDTKFKIHISQAELGSKAIYDLLVQKNLPFLEIEFVDYPNETHNSVVAPSIKRGLQFIYK